MNHRAFRLSFATVMAAILTPMGGSAESTATLPRPAISGIANVALYSHNLSTSRAYYRNYLGYSVREPGDAQLARFEVNDLQQIELHPELAAGTDRLGHIGLITNDAEGVRQYLRRRGFPAPVTLDQGATGERSFRVRDPDGHMIQFVQRTSDSGGTRMRGRAQPPLRISPRIRHAGFIVADLAASLKFYQDLLGRFLHARSLPAGCKTTSTMKTGRNGKRQFNCYDPDGTRTEIMEPVTIDGRPVPSSSAPLPNQPR